MPSMSTTPAPKRIILFIAAINEFVDYVLQGPGLVFGLLFGHLLHFRHGDKLEPQTPEYGIHLVRLVKELLRLFLPAVPLPLGAHLPPPPGGCEPVFRHAPGLA